MIGHSAGMESNMVRVAQIESQYWSVTLRGPDGHRYPPRLVRASLIDPDSFRPHLIGVARIEVPDVAATGEQWIGKFEPEVSAAGQPPDEACRAALRWDR
jgi:hypothetical protein